MSIEFTGVKLTNEDLGRWQIVSARIMAIETTDGSMSSMPEIEAAYRQRFALGEDLLTKYGIEDSRNWVVSVYTGTIWYEDD